MTYVYLLQSIAFPDQKYIGSSFNLKKRLDAHNEGRSTPKHPNTNPGNYSATSLFRMNLKLMSLRLT